jgi:hypothetical protein
MKAASLKEIKKELETLDPETARDLCLRLAKYKKESKELLTYLLFEAGDERGYIESVKRDLAEMFAEVPNSNVYYVKKSLRKILRFVNRQIRYSGLKQTEIALRISFCVLMKAKNIYMPEGSVLFKLYDGQVDKIEKGVSQLPEDIQGDYQRDVENLGV